MGCVRTWQRSISFEANTRSTQEISVPNQSWGGCHHPASNWSYQGHKVPYLVSRTSDYLTPLWTRVDDWPHALGKCSFAGNSGWILHCWLLKDPLGEHSRDLHSWIFKRSRILLTDMNCPWLQTVCKHYLCRTTNMPRRTCVVVKQIQSNQLQYLKRYWDLCKPVLNICAKSGGFNHNILLQTCSKRLALQCEADIWYPFSVTNRSRGGCGEMKVDSVFLYPVRYLGRAQVQHNHYHLK